MRYLSLGEVVELHRRLLEATGGAPGIRDIGVLDSAIAQPRTTFDGMDLYPTLIEKAPRSDSHSWEAIPSSTATSASLTLRWRHFWY